MYCGVDADLSPAIVVTASQTTQMENGGPVTISVTLSSSPATPVTVTATTTQCQRQYLVPASPVVTFNDLTYANPFGFQLFAVNDNLMQGNGSCVIVINSISSSADFNDLSASLVITVIDDDTAGIVMTNGSLHSLTADNSKLMIYELTSGYIGVQLQSEPNADITIDSSTSSKALTSSDITISPDQWNTIQHLSITANSIASTEWVSLSLELQTADTRFQSLSYHIDVLVIDTGNPDVIQVSPALANTTDTANDTTQVYVILVHPIPGPITVSMSSSNPSLAYLSPSSIQITPDMMGVVNPVTITGVQDNIATGNQSFIAFFRASGSGVDTTVSLQLYHIDTDIPALNCTPKQVFVNETGMRIIE